MSHSEQIFDISPSHLFCAFVGRHMDMSHATQHAACNYHCLKKVLEGIEQGTRGVLGHHEYLARLDKPKKTCDWLQRLWLVRNMPTNAKTTSFFDLGAKLNKHAK